MKRYAVILGLLILCLGVTPELFAQYEDEKDATIPLEHFYVKRQGISPFRRILSKITFGLSTGYGQTNFNHELTGYGVLQNPGSDPLTFPVSNPTTLYGNWFNEVTPSTQSAQPGAFTITSEEDKIGFRNKAFNIPLQATLHVEIKERFRIGGGYSFTYTNLGDFEPISHGNDINGFEPDVSGFFLKKYFGLLGVNLYRYYDYLLVADAQIGGYGLGKNFDKGSISKGVFFNFGVTVEREMSEYFRLFVRPSYEIKGYQLGLPQGPAIKHNFNAFYINVGATYRIPELRKCFEKTCRAQKNHAHGNREYRSRVHPIYKKQNPHYGENYPTLIKYKGKNKKKLNPY
ncbi:MAG TPA: hypothetical protein VD884_12550 [Ohtaekwangia sp.]|nr:hypothetical protein [Ohtaekwangia sp.]